MSADTTYHLLLVDDEPNILKALRRLFQELENTAVHIAESAKEATAVFREHQIDLVISDEKMPEVEGHRFIQWVKKHYPDTLRIILTGFADMEAMRHAVNRGDVYRYLFKPWDDNELLVIVQNALEHSRSNRQRDELMAHLTELVEQRTAELNRAMAYIRRRQQETERSLGNTLAFLDSVIAMINRETGGRTMARRIADIAGALARGATDDASGRRYCEMAAYFFPIGALSLGRSLEESLQTDGTIPADILRESQHLVGSTLNLPDLAAAIGHVDERWDGGGAPDGLSGGDIPLVSRVVRIALDFVVHQDVHGKPEGSVRSMILSHAGTIYDPALVKRLMEILDARESRQPRSLTVTELVAGMVLADDLRLDNGMTYITAGTSLTREMIDSVMARVETPRFPLSEGSTVLIQRESSP